MSNVCARRLPLSTRRRIPSNGFHATPPHDPQNQRGVSYYGRDAAAGYSSHVYLIGNHALHYAVLAGWGLVAAAALLFVRYRNDWGMGPGLARFKPFFAQAAFCLMVYTVNLLPYVGVARSTFIYHYMPALVYGELMLARLVESVLGPRYTKYGTVAILLGLGGVVLHFAPWIYATPLTSEGQVRRR
jgi:dolichyl-phosphate-mannose--protein O-mannosyl transferase